MVSLEELNYCLNCKYSTDGIICDLLDDLVIGYCFMYQQKTDELGE